MTSENRDTRTIEAVQAVLMAMIPPINQQFFHSRMLRAWGHSQGAARNTEWIEKMRRTGALVPLLRAAGGGPCDRDAVDITIGTDARSVLEADAAQTRWFIGVVESALDDSADDDARCPLEGILAAERADLDTLETLLDGPEAGEAKSQVKHLLPKPGGAETAIAAINRVLPAMSSAVSQIFFHSLIFSGEGRDDIAQRELDAALRMMFRSEALLERLLDLGGLPSATGHGRVRIGEGGRGSDETALAVHETIIAGLEEGLATLAGLVDPMTHTLIDGILRAEHSERDSLRARLEG